MNTGELKAEIYRKEAQHAKGFLEGQKRQRELDAEQM
jgi:hypothetical protein